jgi:cysteine/O-acetylserine efflux protein
MSIHLLPLLSYVLISTFTPGPSNISSASMGVLHGYRNTLNYQTGLAAGVFVFMLCSGLISTTLLGWFPALEPALRYVGAAYILYLAFGILKAGYVFAEQSMSPLGLGHGFMLQILNPKLFVYAFTVFSGFLAPITGSLPLIVLASALLAAISFSATSIWAAFGTIIKTSLRKQGMKTAVNIILALLLAYSSIALAGII